jgi:hypothetical protein
MPNLTHLRLTDLTLDPLEDFDDLGLAFNSLLRSLVCEDIGDVAALQYLVEYLDQVTNLTLTRCTVGNATCEAQTLVLKEIDDGVDYLDNLLCFWSGKSLYLDSCPGFNDAFLERMCVPANRVVASLMQFLDISNCLDFSVPALKRLVESDYGCLAFEGMRISGDSPFFSPEDILWFTERLTYFVFTPEWYTDDQTS